MLLSPISGMENHQRQAANWTLLDPSADYREVLAYRIHPDASHLLLKEKYKAILFHLLYLPVKRLMKDILITLQLRQQLC